MFVKIVTQVIVSVRPKILKDFDISRVLRAYVKWEIQSSKLLISSPNFTPDGLSV